MSFLSLLLPQFNFFTILPIIVFVLALIGLLFFSSLPFEVVGARFWLWIFLVGSVVVFFFASFVTNLWASLTGKVIVGGLFLIILIGYFLFRDDFVKKKRSKR